MFFCTSVRTKKHKETSVCSQLCWVPTILVLIVSSVYTLTDSQHQSSKLGLRSAWDRFVFHKLEGLHVDANEKTERKLLLITCIPRESKCLSDGVEGF